MQFLKDIFFFFNVLFLTTKILNTLQILFLFFKDENADPNRLSEVGGLLEKKWTLTTRLQQKVLVLEEKLKQMDHEAMFGAPSR